MEAAEARAARPATRSRGAAGAPRLRPPPQRLRAGLRGPRARRRRRGDPLALHIDDLPVEERLAEPGRLDRIRRSRGREALGRPCVQRCLAPVRPYGDDPPCPAGLHDAEIGESLGLSSTITGAPKSLQAEIGASTADAEDGADRRAPCGRRRGVRGLEAPAALSEHDAEDHHGMPDGCRAHRVLVALGTSGPKRRRRSSIAVSASSPEAPRTSPSRHAPPLGESLHAVDLEAHARVAAHHAQLEALARMPVDGDAVVGERDRHHVGRPNA